MVYARMRRLLWGVGEMTLLDLIAAFSTGIALGCAMMGAWPERGQPVFMFGLVGAIAVAVGHLSVGWQ